MKLDITAKNIALTPPLRVFIEDKMGDLDHLLSDYVATAKVEVGKPSKHHRSGPVFYAEANVKVNGKLLRAQAKHEDVRSAIVDVKEELRIQIGKLKEKKRDLARKAK